MNIGRIKRIGLLAVVCGAAAARAFATGGGAEERPRREERMMDMGQGIAATIRSFLPQSFYAPVKATLHRLGRICLPSGSRSRDGGVSWHSRAAIAAGSL